jgi:hypothetical protein
VIRGISRAHPAVLAAAGFVAFAGAAVANSAGYRFGVSDQAFYLPAAARAFDPARFPRDAALIDAQARLTGADEILAGAIRLAAPLGFDLPSLVAVAYAGGVLLLFVATLAFGRALFGKERAWTIGAFVAALTLRHGISRAGVNTLEGYFHPRLIVFAAGVLALAWFLRGRTWRALALVIVAGAIHPTTALWFGVWIAVAGIVADARARRLLLALAAAAMVAAGYLILAGPLAGRVVAMDAAWLAPLAGKDYLFPDRWPAYAWIANLSYIGVIGLMGLSRRRRGKASAREHGLTVGALVLAAIFLACVPLNYVRIALVVQLQIARVFWMLDFLATALLVSWLTQWRPMPVTLLLMAASVMRGFYIMTVEFPDRPLVRVSLPADEWRDVMVWATRTRADTHWLAHPGHAHLYGSSVRVAASRDVLHEETKDAAVAMYSREIALRVSDRSAALADFDALDAPRLRALAARYDLDYVVTEGDNLALPVAYRNGKFTVYRLRDEAARVWRSAEAAEDAETNQTQRPQSTQRTKN